MATRATRAPKRRTVRPPKPTWYEMGPFVGVRDAPFMDDDDDKYFISASNGYLIPGDMPRFGVRPGFVSTSDVVGGTPAQQWLGQYTWSTAAGVVTETTMCFVGGTPYILNWTTHAWASVALGGVAVSATAPMIHAWPASNKIVFNDGVNPPFFYDGRTGTFTAITLKVGGVAADQVAYGRPAVKDAKLIFIRNNDRTRICWSETDDPTLGYEQAGYANFHSLTQTSSDPLYAIHATNDGLYFFRSFSIGIRRGQINSEYSTAATNDEISPTVGTRSPGAVCAVGVEGGQNAIWFVDASARPHRIVPGQGVENLSRGCSQALKTSALDAAEKFWGVNNPTTGVVVFGLYLAAFSTTVNNLLLSFTAASGTFTGTWSTGSMSHSGAAGLVRRAAPKGVGQPSMAMLGTQTANTRVQWQKGESDFLSQWGYEVSNDDATYVPMVVSTGHLGAGDVGEKQFDWAEAVVYDVGAVSLSWVSSLAEVGGPVTPDGSVAGGAYSTFARSYQAGLLANARWLQTSWTLTPTAGKVRPAIERIRVRSVPVGDPPGTA